MPDAGLKGVSADQDRRYKDKDAEILKSTKFSKSFNEKVDMRKVNTIVFKPWISKKVIDLIGFEDDIVIEYIYDLLEDVDNPIPDPRKMQIALTGFLENNTANFMQNLWDLLLDAQRSDVGIPRIFLEEKKKEIIAKSDFEDKRRRERDDIKRSHFEADRRRGDRRRDYDRHDYKKTTPPRKYETRSRSPVDRYRRYNEDEGDDKDNERRYRHGSVTPPMRNRSRYD